MAGGWLGIGWIFVDQAIAENGRNDLVRGKDWREAQGWHGAKDMPSSL